MNNGVKASKDIQLFWLSFNYNVYTTYVLTISFYPFKRKPTNCFSVFDHFVGLASKGLM